MQPGNLQDEQRKLVDGVDELKRREDPKTATSLDCKRFDRMQSKCFPRLGGVEYERCTMRGEPCPSNCDAFKPRAKGGRRA